MKRHEAAASACALLLMFVARTSEAQVLYTLESPNPEADGYFGISVSGAGDVNSDGYADVAVGAYFEDGADRNAGRAYIFSGPTGSLLHTLQSPNPETDGHFGFSVSGAGDVNGDGHADIVVGALLEDGGLTNAGQAYVISGQTGATLWTLTSPNPGDWGFFGYSVSGAGDMDNDGHADVAVGAPYEAGGGTGLGQAYIFSGQTGAPLWTLQSPYAQTGGHFGVSVSGAGDVNDDGYADVVVGADMEHGGAPSAGRAYVFSGQTGSLLWTLESPNAQYQGYFGFSVSGTGDVNSDGCADVSVGAYHEDGAASEAGRAYVFSGQTGGLLHALQSPNAEAGGWFGYSVSGAGDLDNDGCDDIIAGAISEDGGATDAGRTYAFSGQTGSLLWTLPSPSPEMYGYFGYSVSGAGDVNNAGYDDFTIGACCEDGGATNSGRAYVFAPMDVPIELASFRAVPRAGAVRLAWVTLSEKDNLGFNIDRASTESGPFARVNEGLIRGGGTTSTPHTYSYLDETVEPGTTYWYRLEDVSLSGDRTLHGPIEVLVPGAAGLGLEVLGSRDPSFLLSFAIPGRASLDLYDVSGKRVASLWEGWTSDAGTTTIRPATHRTIAPGLYTAVLSQNSATVARSVVLAR